MTRHPWLDPSPFAFSSGETGVLLIHGFTGAPTEMRPLGEYLASHGYTVRGPLLPGHGTKAEDLNAVSWKDWAHVVEDNYRALRSHCQRVFVAGLSLGGLLALELASRHREAAGLILYAPALLVTERRLPLSVVFRHVRPLIPKDGLGDADLWNAEAHNRIWCYDYQPVGGGAQVWFLQRQIRKTLQRVTQPTILFQGRRDRSVRADSPYFILGRLGSTETRLIWLEKSGHNLLVDAGREEVFAETLTWIRAHE